MNLLKKILLLLVVTLTLVSDMYANTTKKTNGIHSAYFSDAKIAKLREELANLKPEKRAMLIKAYSIGVEHNKSTLLPAIALQESTCDMNCYTPGGKYGAYGPFQIQLETALAALHLKDTATNSRMVKYKLKTDFNYGAALCLNELRYWETKYTAMKKDKQTVRKMTIASYNTGNISSRCTLGMKYYAGINLREKLVKEYLETPPAIYMSKYGKPVDRYYTNIHTKRTICYA